MKKYKWLPFICLLAALACEDKEEEEQIIPEQQVQEPVHDDTTSVVVEPEKAPVWTPGFPIVKYGATSVDLAFQTDKVSNVYYLLSSTALTITPNELIAQAKVPTNPEIKFNGFVKVNANESVTQSVKDLTQGKKYFAYAIAANEVDSVLDATISTNEFDTFIRQDTLQFSSTFEKRKVDYLLYQPEEVLKNPDQKYPFIMFLGGQGERAMGNKRINVIQNGLLPEYIHKGNDLPMIVMSVQHLNKDWDNELITEALDHAMQTLPIDKSRVYMIGTSAGAFGVWRFASEFPDRLTAIVPISGGGKEEKACQFKNLATWAFHNKSDHLVHPDRSRSMIAAINECKPSSKALLQIFPDAGHDCWRRIFDPTHPDWAKSPNAPRVKIFDWLLEQNRPTVN